MKSKFKNRKTFIELAEKMGLSDATQLTGQMKPGTTDQPYLTLVNNQRRFVKGLLRLPEKEQLFRISELRRIIAEQEAKESARRAAGIEE